jgi:hypothetical protein
MMLQALGVGIGQARESAKRHANGQAEVVELLPTTLPTSAAGQPDDPQAVADVAAH